MSNRILAALATIAVVAANGATAQTAIPALAYAPTAVETTVGPLDVVAEEARADRPPFGSRNATTAHRTGRLGQTIAPRIGLGPSTTEAAQDASTAHETARRPGHPSVSRVGASPSAAESIHNASTAHPRG